MNTTSPNKRLFQTIIVLLFLLSLLLGGYFYINKKINALIAQRYSKVSTQMQEQLQTLIEGKKKTILDLALAVADDSDVQKAILRDEASLLHLHQLSLRLRKNSNLKNIWFQVVKADGVSLYRSFTAKRGDNVLKARADIAKVLKHPQIITTISSGKFSSTIKALVPIYKNHTFIGIIETIAKFHSIVNIMDKLGYKTVIFVDKSYKKQMVFADKKRFLDGYFIASGDVNSDLLEYVKEKGIEHIITYNSKKYHVCEEINSIVKVYTLDDAVKHKAMLYFMMAYNLNNIDLGDINQIRYNLFLVLGGLLFTSLALFMYFFLRSKKRFVEQLNDSLEEKVKEKTKELTYFAHYDALTGLLNRHQFSNLMQSSIESAKREGSSFTLLFLDLDTFKDINDTYGHNVGDALLVSVAKRLKLRFKQADFVARLGGDEFIVLIKSISEDDLTALAKRVIAQMQEPVEFEHHIINVTFSIGICRFPEDGDDAQTLLSHADIAMYKAKDFGRNTFQFYDRKMGLEIVERLELEKHLKVALKENQFEAFYQPQVDAVTNRVVGAEALIRWNSPELGMVSPDRFIPVAEGSDLIIKIDSWMMQATMHQFKAFEEEGIETGKLSLNLSARQLESKEMMDHLKTMLEKMHFDPKRLELEITERQMMKDPEASIIRLNRIKEMGIDIAVDDFGTGHSSLSYIKRLPIDKLKIDKTFVDELPDNKEDIAIVRSVISIGTNLGMKLIAEGVESETQRDFLRDEGCRLVQGYFYSKPLRTEEFKQFLLEHNQKKC